MYLPGISPWFLDIPADKAYLQPTSHIVRKVKLYVTLQFLDVAFLHLLEMRASALIYKAKSEPKLI